MPRRPTDERLRRLLAMVPWVVAREGPTVDEVCERFDLTRDELVAELELLFLCGLHPFSPDTLIEADIVDDRVWIRFADFFARPLRLTPAEGLALVAAGSALLAVQGADGEGALARGLAKVAAVLGVAADEAVEVDLADPGGDVLSELRAGAAARRQVEIDYYAFGRDERTTRVIEPWSIFSAGGHWYVLANCLRAGGERLFRIDRIERAATLEQTFEPPGRPPERALYRPRPSDPAVVLRLAAGARWVAEQYPVEAVHEEPGGWMRVTLRVSERAWLERLLLALGSDATVVSGPDHVARGAAERVLRRYRRTRALSSKPSD